MSNGFDIKAFEEELQKDLDELDGIFNGTYKAELNELMGLSRAEIDQITPDITDLKKYEELITVVKKASKVNLSQALLRERIEKLGDVAVKIAKHVPSLAKLFL
ncbi:MAG: hypothetical protein QNJ58_26325 [Desulfobacterales bacterium]|nr:hypothetical protein [Desulfobacterales bacterium]